MTRGFSLLELLIALSIAATTLIAATMITLGMPGVIANTRLHADAERLARSGFAREMARGPEGYAHMSTIATTSTDVYDHAVYKDMVGDGSTRRIKSDVLWHSLEGSARSFSITGIVTDYRNAADYVCSPLLLGSWSAPSRQEFTAHPLPPLSSLAASRAYVIAAASTTAGITDPALFVFEPSGPDSGLALTGTFDPATTSRIGYVDIAISGTTAYALTAQSSCGTNEPLCARLDILSLAPVPIRRLASIPLPVASTVTAHGGRVYLGLEKDDGPEMIVIDVLQPDTPARIGDAEIGRKVNDILVSNGTIYVATAENKASEAKAVVAFDDSHVSPGMEPTMRTWPGMGGGLSRQLALSNGVLYLGRSYLHGSRGFLALDASRITITHASAEISSNVNGLIVRGFQAFVLTKNALERWDVNDPSSLLPFPEQIPLPVGTTGTALACRGSTLYVAANTAAAGRLMALTGT